MGLDREGLRTKLDAAIEDNVIGGTDDFPAVNRAGLLGDLDSLLAEALATLPAAQRVSVNEAALDMARHWIDRYATGIDAEPQMDRILSALAPQEPPSDMVLVPRELVEAFHSLTNSADGLSFREDAIRNIIGNTNWRILRDHIAEARAMLAAAKDTQQ